MRQRLTHGAFVDQLMCNCFPLSLFSLQCDAVCRIPSYDLVNKMFEHRQLMQANGYEKRGAGLAGKDKWIRAPTLTTQ